MLYEEESIWHLLALNSSQIFVGVRATFICADRIKIKSHLQMCNTSRFQDSKVTIYFLLCHKHLSNVLYRGIPVFLGFQICDTFVHLYIHIYCTIVYTYTVYIRIYTYILYIFVHTYTVCNFCFNWDCGYHCCSCQTLYTVFLLQSTWIIIWPKCRLSYISGIQNRNMKLFIRVRAFHYRPWNYKCQEWLKVFYASVNAKCCCHFL